MILCHKFLFEVIKMKSRFFALVLALLIVISNYPVTTAFAMDTEDLGPVTSIELTATRDLVEGADASYNEPEPGKGYDYYWFADTRPDVTLKYSDGTTRVCTWDSVYEYINGYDPLTPQDYENQCKVGENTQTIRFYFYEDGIDDYYVDTTYTFNIVENPVESFSVTINDTLIENIDGRYEDIYDMDDNYLGKYFDYNIGALDKEITVKYTDGTTKTYTEHELYETTNYFGLNDITYQQDNPLKVGKNTVKFAYMGKTAEAVVEVVETPVKSIKAVTNRSLIENVDGSVRDRYNEDTESSEQYFGYTLYRADFLLEVTYKNGNVETYDYADIMGDEWEGYGLQYPIYFDGVQYSADDTDFYPELKLGENKIKVSYMNCETDLVVKVIENPVKSISLKCGPISELDSLKSWDSYWDENGECIDGVYEKYDVPEDTSTITINYKDSTRKSDTLTLEDVYYAFGYDVYTDLPQSLKEPLTPGKHKGTAYFMGVTCEFDFEIAPNPVKSITAKATRDLIENRDGRTDVYWDAEAGEEYLCFLYSISKTYPEITVNYTDGTSKTFSYEEVSNLNTEFIIDTNQSHENKLKVGDNTATITLFKKTCELKFKIVEDKIDNIVLTPTATLSENIDGYFVEYEGKDEYFEYDLEKLAPIVTINYKDGSKEEYDYLTVKRYVDIDFDLSYGIDQSQAPFKLGDNTLKVNILGRDVEMKFKVVDPAQNLKIKSIEVIPEDTLLENTDARWVSEDDEETDEWYSYLWYDISVITYTAKVTYEDGSVKTFTGLSSWDEIDGSYFSVYDNQQSYKNQFKVGKNKLTATYREATCEFEVEVVANPYTAVEISGENELYVTFIKADGTKDTHKIVTCNLQNGILVTEDGRVFNSIIEYDYEYTRDGVIVSDYRFRFENGDDYLVSNKLETNNWLSLSFVMWDVTYPVALYADGYSQRFYGRDFTGIPTGTVTGTLVDDILTICTNRGQGKFKDEKGMYTYLSVENAESLVSLYFDPDRFDFTSSPMYDEKTGLIKVYCFNSHEGGISNERLEYKDDMFVYTADFESNYTTKSFTVIVKYENGVYFVDSINIHGGEDHVYDDGVIAKESTCTVKGTKLFTCECGATRTEELELAPHKDVYVGTKDVHAKCSVCGTTNANHVYTKTEVIKEATATEKGKEKVTCDCGYSYEIETAVHELGNIEIKVDKTNSFSGTVSSVVDVKAKLELTPNEKALIDAGEDLELVFKLDDIGTKVDTAEKEAIAEVLGEKKLGAFLDVSLIKQIGNYEGKVEKLTAPIRVALEVPTELINTDTSVERVYKVLRYHDSDENKVTVLDAKFDKATGILTFETDRFSTYALVYEDVEAGKDEVPNAGVVSTTVIWLGAMSVSGIGALALARKKKEY